MIRAHPSQKTIDSLKKNHFMPKSISLLSLFAQLLFFKEQWEWLFLVTLYKRTTLSESLPSLSLLFKKSKHERFAHKKWAIGLKHRWANSQPWVSHTKCHEIHQTFVVTVNETHANAAHCSKLGRKREGEALRSQQAQNSKFAALKSNLWKCYAGIGVQ